MVQVVFAALLVFFISIFRLFHFFSELEKHRH